MKRTAFPRRPIWRAALGALAVTGALCAGLAPAHAQDEKRVTIAMVTHGQAADGFWTRVKNGATLAAQQMNVNLQYRAPETFDMVRMAALIQAAAAQHPDGLIVTIPDPTALGGAIKGAVAEGIPVIGMNAGGTVYQSLGLRTFVGQDEYQTGVLAGQRLAAAGGKDALCVNQEVGNAVLDMRCQGFAKGFGGKVTVLPATDDAADTQSRIRAALMRDPGLDTILGLSAPLGGEPAVAAVASLGIAAKVKIGCFDLSGPYVTDVAQGKALFAIDQSPFLQGYLSVVIAATNARYGVMTSGVVSTGPNFVTKDTASQVIALSSRGIR